MYHIRGWGKFNRHYGDFCTGADTNRSQIVQSEPNGVFSFQQLTSEPDRNHSFAKPFWGPKNSNEGSNPSLSAIS